MPLNSWSEEFWRLASLITLCLILGLVFNKIVLLLIMGGTLYLGWHVFNLYRLDRWLRGASHTTPPEARGIWGEVFHHFYLLQKRNNEHKKKLTAMLDRFQQLTTAMPDGTVVLNAKGGIEWFNDAAGRLLGLRHQDVGQHILNLVRQPTFVGYLEQYDFAEPLELNSPVDEKCSLQIHVVPYGRGQRLIVARDITRLQQLEQMRRDFVANVSHELRTPLTVITGYLETLTDDSDLHAMWGQSLKVMQEQSDRMQHIVEDLLLLAKLEGNNTPPPHDPVSVPSLLAGIRDDAVSLTARKGHRIKLDMDENLWLYGNEQQLRSAFSNLVFNAIRYMPDPGTVTINWHSANGGAQLDVQDTGIGIAAHHISRLTERFYRVDVGRSRETGGTGLGLAIVKHVLNRHRATLKIYSKPEQGSTFSCRFPSHAIMHHSNTANPQSVTK
ncbi:MAG: phosphate regulon sensor histidine kinase PhoR [Gammaproteobacteria bacterium]|nr:phosphate regulon sensor histidine kinase PhoR [Gammaproteobacteria bacterium]